MSGVENVPSDGFFCSRKMGKGNVMNSFLSWVGGKKLLRDEVIIRMPPFYEKYIEVFGGAGWVLFRKSPENEIEVFNDFNSNLVNLYR